MRRKRRRAALPALLSPVAEGCNIADALWSNVVRTVRRMPKRTKNTVLTRAAALCPGAAKRHAASTLHGWSMAGSWRVCDHQRAIAAASDSALQAVSRKTFPFACSAYVRSKIRSRRTRRAVATGAPANCFRGLSRPRCDVSCWVCSPTAWKRSLRGFLPIDLVHRLQEW